MDPRHVIAIGVNTGHGGICIVDIDGASAADWLKLRGADPSTCHTWKITRNTDDNRYKLVFRLTPEQQQLFPQTKLLLRTVKGEALEIYFRPGAQCLVLGEHCASGGMYGWVNTPADIATPDQDWLGALQAIAEEVQTLRGKGDPTRHHTKVKGAKGTVPTGAWRGSSHAQPCPVCRRDHSSACTTSFAPDGTQFASCFHGGSFYPPTGLKVGQVIKGCDGQEWAYLHTYQVDTMGEKSMFKVHQPKASPTVPTRPSPPVPVSPCQHSPHPPHSRPQAPHSPLSRPPSKTSTQPPAKAPQLKPSPVISASSPLKDSQVLSLDAKAIELAHEYEISSYDASQIKKQLLLEYNVSAQADAEAELITEGLTLQVIRKTFTLERILTPGKLTDAARIVTRGLASDDLSTGNDHSLP